MKFPSRDPGTIRLNRLDDCVDPLRAEAVALRQRLDDLTRLVSDWVWETDAKLRLTSVSDRAFESLDMTPRELQGRHLTTVFRFADEHAANVSLAHLTPFRSAPCVVTTRSGEQRFLSVSGIPVFDPDSGRYLGYRGTASDLTRDRLAQLALERRDAVMTAVGDVAAQLLSACDWHDKLPAIVRTLAHAAAADALDVFRVFIDTDGNAVTERWVQWTQDVGIAVDGHDRRGAIPFSTTALATWEARLRAGHAVNVATAPSLSQPARALVGEEARGPLLIPIHAGNHWWGYFRFERRQTHTQWADPEIEALKTAAGIVGAAIHRRQCEQELRRHEARLQHQAHHDQLTDLPNRFRFFETLDQAMAKAQLTGASLSLLSIDLDHFQRCNDGLGPEAGDEILRQVGRRLFEFLGSTDTAARIAGDEFSLLLTGRRDRPGIADLAPKIHASLAAPYRVGDQDVYVHASIGIAVFPDDAADGIGLLQCADTARRRVKRIGGNAWQFFRCDMNAQPTRAVILSQHLHHALEKQQLELFYQPLVAAQSGCIVAAEALLRWRHPEFGLVPPGEFIGLAEEGGLIESIGNWVLQEACRQAGEWRKLGFGDVRISVNVSSRQLQRGQMLASVLAALSRGAVPASSLCVEITESAVLEDAGESIAILEKLHGLGVEIAVDDFGTGYASLTYLQKLPVDIIKIDRSFIRELSDNAADSAIVDAIIAMAKRMDLTVVAEGVEQEDQLRLLRESGCDLIQGFLFSQAVPADKFVDLLRNGFAARVSAARPKELALMSG